jgi:hypothetical protein
MIPTWSRRDKGMASGGNSPELTRGLPPIRIDTELAGVEPCRSRTAISEDHLSCRFNRGTIESGMDRQGAEVMGRANYLIFGDLHGRILPAFRLASAWSREHGVALSGLLQVGDLGYFPDPSRLDKATAKFAADDPLELGAQVVTSQNGEADAVFHGEGYDVGRLWFTAGNHEDFDALDRLGRQERQGTSFAVDAYERVACIKDGSVETIPGGLRVGALWGIDDQAPNARRKKHPLGRIRDSSLTKLAGARFDVLLSHDGPRDAVLVNSGSEGLTTLLALARPRFAFFGHYGSRFGQVEVGAGRTQVYHLAGMEMRRNGSTAEAGSVGLLTWEDGEGNFEYLDDAWLRTFTRHNWRHR